MPHRICAALLGGHDMGGMGNTRFARHDETNAVEFVNGVQRSGIAQSNGMQNEHQAAMPRGQADKETPEPGTAVIITLPLSCADISTGAGIRIGEPAVTAR